MISIITTGSSSGTTTVAAASASVTSITVPAAAATASASVTSITAPAAAAARHAFVFIHGYNVSFEDAARRTGQIAFDLHFVGAPIFYSWPPNGKVADYQR